MRKRTSVIEERRKHARLPILHGILEPVEITFSDIRLKRKDQASRSQPAILSDLSAGGLRLLTFLEPPHSKMFDIVLQLPGLEGIPVEGKITWVRGKGGVYMSGISFTKISKHSREKINILAEDYADCDTRLALKLPEVCNPDCKCHSLCNKPQKDETMFKKTAASCAKA